MRVGIDVFSIVQGGAAIWRAVPVHIHCSIGLTFLPDFHDKAPQYR